MRRFFDPDSVVIYGVSARPDNMGRHVVENLQQSGFRGAVHPIGRGGGTVAGRMILEDLADVPHIPDVAVLLLPAAAIPQALEECGRKGVRRAIVLSAGFSELYGEKKVVERDLSDVARKWGIRVMGPNCIGVASMESGFTSFFFAFDMGIRKTGNVSLIAQSGGIVIDSARMLYQEAIGFNKLVSMGNKLDLNENDYLEFLASDPGTRVIALHLEHIVDGRRLMDTAAATDKPIVILKSNRGAVSNQIAQFHTAALAGDDEVADAGFRQAGIVRAQSMGDMLNLIKVFSLPQLSGPRMAAIGRSGGQCVLIADALHHYGLKLAELSPDFFRLARQATRAGVMRMTNPLDTGDIFSPEVFEGLMEKAVQEAGVDGLVISWVKLLPHEVESTKSILSVARRLCDQYGKPIIFCMAPDPEDAFREQKHAFPTFDDLDPGLRTLAWSYQRARIRARMGKRKVLGRPRPAAHGKKRISVAHAGDIFDALERYRIPPVPFAVADAAGACAQARALGYPLALKSASVNLLHKTEAGGVALDIKSEPQLERALEAMTTNLRRQGLESGDYLLQKMAPSGVEVFIGGKQDPEFGPVILFGLGGLFVEVMNDVSMRIAPVDMKTARDMIEEIKGYALLKGFRGRPVCDVSALAQCVVHVSRLLAEHREIAGLDINPLMVLEEGKGCLVVDAKMEVV